MDSQPEDPAQNAPLPADGGSATPPVLPSSEGAPSAQPAAADPAPPPPAYDPSQVVPPPPPDAPAPGYPNAPDVPAPGYPPQQPSPFPVDPAQAAPGYYDPNQQPGYYDPAYGVNPLGLVDERGYPIGYTPPEPKKMSGGAKGVLIGCGVAAAL